MGTQAAGAGLAGARLHDAKPTAAGRGGAFAAVTTLAVAMLGCGARTDLGPSDDGDGFCSREEKVEVDGEAWPVSGNRIAIAYTPPQRVLLHWDGAGSTVATFGLEAPVETGIVSAEIDLAAIPAGWRATAWLGDALADTTTAEAESPPDTMRGRAVVHATADGLSLFVCAGARDPARGIDVRLYGAADL